MLSKISFENISFLHRESHKGKIKINLRLEYGDRIMSTKAIDSQ
ncbi:hypothetical protein [Nostoc sp.]